MTVDKMMEKAGMPATRRTVLIGGALASGGLLVACTPVPQGRAAYGPAVGGEEGAIAVSAFVSITPDNKIQIACGRAEMGQGVHSGYAQLVAEELEADWSDVSVIQPPANGAFSSATMITDALPFGDADENSVTAFLRRRLARGIAGRLPMQVTGGSSSIRDGWVHMREMGAMAREMLVAAAASSWGVPVHECKAAASQVVHVPTGRTTRFGDVAEKAATLAPPARPKLKAHKDFALVGQPMARPDLPAKVDGTAQFGIDVRREGQLYAALAQCPILGGDVKSFDEEAARAAVPGFVKAVRVTDGVAAVASNTWAARQALEALNIEWDGKGHETRNTRALRAEYWAQLGDAGDDTAESHADWGDARAVLAKAADTFSADYEVPFLAHATMEPMNTTALVENGTCTIWSPCQSAGPAVPQAAKAAGVPEDKVTFYTTLLGGGFGRRAEVDYVLRAVEVARAMPGTPIQTVWSREEDMTHSTYRPMMLTRIKAALDETGQPTAWVQRAVGQGASSETMPRMVPFMPEGPDGSSAEGIKNMNYAMPAMALDHVRMKSPVKAGFWRSVGHSQNGFFKESFVDELAHKAGADPYEYRRALLKDAPRALGVLERVAEMAHWGGPVVDGHAKGIAVHESFGSFVAEVAEISIAEEGLRVHKVWVAVDCGAVVNPDSVEAQMISGVIYGLTAALYGEITLEDGAVVQQNFPDYQMLRLSNAPDVEVSIIDSSESPGGVGEPGTPPIAPAVANAVFALNGQRIRTLPLMHELDIA